MAVKYQHTKSGRVFTAPDGSRVAKLMSKDEGYTVYSEPEAATDVEKMTLPQLKAYADEQGIELTATKKAEVLAEIQAAEADAGDGDDEADSDDE